MSLALECRKIKRTGLTAAFLGGELLASAVPVLNMAYRPELYLHREASPVNVLLGAGWQMMVMLNVLLIVTGACALYHMEYADNAILKMCSLPVKESGLFFGKAFLIAGLSAVFLLMEAVSVAGCAVRWFGTGREVCGEVLRNLGFSLLLLLPAILLALLIASVCKNMWIALGVGVIGVLIATMIPAGQFAASLFPFALPFRTLSGLEQETIRGYVTAGAAETAAISVLEIILLRVRRAFQ